MKQFSKVKVWGETVILPTYEIGAPDKNPMYLEKRVYQGSSGKVYPHPVIDKIYDTKTDKKYKAVFLENDYIKVMLLPEIGGRIQRATDKTNGYDFVYYNQVIKPALVGLAGPWISGGIEFNWPQHHRPSTFDAVDYSRGVDISRYKNLSVPTSYMAAKSDYDFVGGYDDGVNAGILHVADRILDALYRGIRHTLYGETDSEITVPEQFDFIVSGLQG